MLRHFYASIPFFPNIEDKMMKLYTRLRIDNLAAVYFFNEPNCVPTPRLKSLSVKYQKIQFKRKEKKLDVVEWI